MKRKLSQLVAALLCIGVMLTSAPLATAGDMGKVSSDSEYLGYYRINPTRLLTIAYLVVGLDINGTTANCYGDCMGYNDFDEIDLELTLEKYIGFGEWGYYDSWYLRGDAIPGVIMSHYAYNLPVGSYRVYGETSTYYGTTKLERHWLWTNIHRVDP